MISLPSVVRAFVCTRSVDMRKSFDGPSGLVEERFRQDLLDGRLVLFVNRRRDRIKVLDFDHDRPAIWYKRPEAGSFQVPDAGDREGIELDPAQLAVILSGIDPETARRRQRFRAAGPSKNEEVLFERERIRPGITASAGACSSGRGEPA